MKTQSGLSGSWVATVPQQPGAVTEAFFEVVLLRCVPCPRAPPQCTPGQRELSPSVLSLRVEFGAQEARGRAAAWGAPALLAQPTSALPRPSAPSSGCRREVTFHALRRAVTFCLPRCGDRPGLPQSPVCGGLLPRAWRGQLEVSPDVLVFATVSEGQAGSARPVTTPAAFVSELLTSH